MNNPVQYIIESIICLAVFFLFYRLVLSRENCFHFNRFYLLTALLAGFVFPLLRVQFPAGPLNNPLFTQYLHPAVIDQAGMEGSNMANVEGWLWWFYYGICGMLFIYFFVKITAILKLVRRGNPEKMKDGEYYLVRTDGKWSTFSFWKYLFWDNTGNLTESHRQQILAHELAHIRQMHTLDNLLVELLMVFCWWNPLVTLYKIAIRDNHEFLADRAVMKAYPEKYPNLIVDQMFYLGNFSMGSHFNKSRIIKRIAMLKKLNTKPVRFKSWLAGFLIMAIFMVISCEHNEMLNQSPESAQTRENKEIYAVAEEQPRPVNGMSAFYQYVNNNLKYPEEAQQAGIEGKVFVQFVLNANGEITQTKTLKGIGHGCDKAAEEVMANGPDWIPGKQQGEPVAVRMVMPITFRLDQKGY